MVKPQSAFFERHGSRGIAVLEQVLAGLAAQAAGRPRRCRCSTSSAATSARPWTATPTPTWPSARRSAADAVTLSPYLGFGSLTSAIRTADDAGRGVFVLARTSNPRAPRCSSPSRAGRSVAQGIVDAAAAANRDALAAMAAREQARAGAVELGDGSGLPAFGPVGVVVGATAEHGLDLSTLSGAVLAPGLGAQGAAPADLAARFAGVRGVVLPTASRSVLAAGPNPAARPGRGAGAARPAHRRAEPPALTASHAVPHGGVSGVTRIWRCRGGTTTMAGASDA